MAHKLYTEEQVDAMLNKARLHKQDDTEMFTNEYLLSAETPIELHGEIKKLIKEMDDRVAAFEKNRDLNKEIDASHGYWDGKRSEAVFVVEKLNYILENFEKLLINTKQ